MARPQAFERDLVDAGFPLPITSNGELIAYQLKIKG